MSIYVQTSLLCFRSLPVVWRSIPICSKAAPQTYSTRVESKFQWLCYAALLKTCAIYAHEIVNKMCLTDTWADFAVHANGQSDWPTDGSDELAVLGQSLDSVDHCRWTHWLKQDYCCMLNYQLSSHWYVMKPITTPICCHSRLLCSRFACSTHIMLTLCSMPVIAFYAQNNIMPTQSVQP